MKELAVKKGFVFPVKRPPHLRSKVSQEFLTHSIKDYHTVNCHNNFCNLHFFSLSRKYLVLEINYKRPLTTLQSMPSIFIVKM